MDVAEAWSPDPVVATVLAHGDSPLLDDVLLHIAEQTRVPDAVVILINGGSNSRHDFTSRGRLQDRGVEVISLNSSANLGVGGGHNRLIETAVTHFKPSWVWICEHDTLPDSDCLEDLLHRSSRLKASGNRVGAVVPNLARNESERVREEGTERPPEEGAWFTFNAVLLNVAAWREIGPLREDFFVGGEDLDFSRRLASAGWSIDVRRRSTGLHPTRGSRRYSVPPSPSRLYYSTRSAILRAPSRTTAVATAAMLACGLPRDLFRGVPFRRISARSTAIIDGLRQRGGESRYWFM